MDSSGDTTHLINQAFRAGLLLTGTKAGAESAILEGIESWPDGLFSQEELLRETVRYSLRYREVLPGNHDSADWAHLPAELQRLGMLPRNLRQCFVLRFLLGYDRETCSQLMHVSLEEVDQRLRLAVRNLALIAAPPIENMNQELVRQV